MRRAFFFHLARPLSFLKELCNCGLEHVENVLQKNRIYVQLTSASFVIGLKRRHRAAWEAALPQSGTALRRPGTEISFVDFALPRHDSIGLNHDRSEEHTSELQS